MPPSYLSRPARCAVIGEGAHDACGDLYADALASRVVDVVRLDVEDVFDAVTSPSGRSLSAHVRDDPQGAALPSTGWTLDRSMHGLFEAAIVTDASGVFGPHLPALMFALDRAGVVLTNSPTGVANRDKWASYELARRAGVRVPLARLATDATECRVAAQELGFPVVLKGLRGTMGEQVRLARSLDELDTLCDELGLGRQPLMVQHYVECNATDRRILVVDGRAVSAMERHARPGDFRANLSLGGVGAVVEPEPDEVRIAEDICRALGLKLAGVDVARVTATLPGRDDLDVGDVFFIEANVFPAITRMSRITNHDVADLVVASVLAELEFRHHLVA